MDRAFKLRVDGVEYQVELHGNSLLVDGQPFVVGLLDGGLTVDGILYDVVLEGDRASVDGRVYQVEAAGMQVRAAEPKKEPAKKAKARAGADSVTAIMPGAILRVLVAEGDQVQEGDVVVILEAMKMENEIHAHKSGQVAKVYVAPGDSVENGQALVEIQ